MYLSAAVMKVNQQAHAGRVSPFHMWHGQPPVHVRTLAMDNEACDSLPKELTAGDEKLADQIKYHVAALMEHGVSCRDEETRDNVAERLASQPHSGYTQFELKVDDKVSHKGKAYTLKEKTGYGTKTVTATIGASDGKQKRVRFDELRPVATPRPTKYISDGKTADIGELVFFDTEEGIMAGIVVTAKGDGFVLHQMEANESARVWLPLWKTVDSQTIVRKKKQPPGAEQLLMNVLQRDVVLTGALSDTGHLSDSTRKALNAMVLTK
jgi:hypothetical protein